jgi:hypothetical protein
MTNSDPSPFHPGSFVVPGQGLETNGGWRGGRSKAWVCTWSTYAQLVPESWLKHTQQPEEQVHIEAAYPNDSYSQKTSCHGSFSGPG